MTWARLKHITTYEGIEAPITLNGDYIRLWSRELTNNVHRQAGPRLHDKAALHPTQPRVIDRNIDDPGPLSVTVFQKFVFFFLFFSVRDSFTVRLFCKRIRWQQTSTPPLPRRTTRKPDAKF